MANFDWENIEKDANRKRFYTISVVIIILVGIIAYFQFFRSNQNVVDQDILDIEENIVSSEKEKEKISEKEYLYTVKVGSFIDFDTAKEFIKNNGIEKFNIYRENKDIYVNLDAFENIQDAQKKREELLKDGFPAIVELFKKTTEEVVVQEKISPEKKEVSEKVFEEPVKEEKKEAEIIEKTVEKEEIINNQVVEEPVAVEENSVKRPDNTLTEGYVIQIAAFKNMNDATFKKNRLRFSGIETKIVKEKDYFKLWIGMFETSKDAKAYAEKLNKSTVPDYFIKKAKW